MYPALTSSILFLISAGFSHYSLMKLPRYVYVDIHITTFSLSLSSTSPILSSLMMKTFVSLALFSTHFGYFFCQGLKYCRQKCRWNRYNYNCLFVRHNSKMLAIALELLVKLSPSFSLNNRISLYASPLDSLENSHFHYFLVIAFNRG